MTRSTTENKKVSILAADLPTKKSEDWRYTDVANLAGDYTVIQGQPKITASEKDTLVIGDRTVDHKVENIFDSIASTVQVRSLTVTKSCVITIVHPEPTEEQLATTRTRITIAEGARVTLLEQWSGNGTKAGLFISSAEIKLQKGSQLQHRIDHRNATARQIKTYRVQAEENSTYECATSTGSASLLRTALHVLLAGKKAETRVRGVQRGDHSQQLDTHVVIKHQAPQTKSSQDIRTVVTGSAHGVVNGGVWVEKTAPGSSVSQYAKSLVLSPSAHSFGKPELRIYTDNVTARHGISIGAVDQAALFYLMSRGQSRESAEQHLIESFANDVLPAELL